MSCFSFTQSNFWLGRFVFPLQTTWYCLENFRVFFSSKNYSFEYTWETKQLKTRIRSVITSIELGPFSSPEVELPLVSTRESRPLRVSKFLGMRREFVSYSQPIRFVRLHSEHAQGAGSPQLAVLDLPGGPHSSCWPNGARPLGTRMKWGKKTAQAKKIYCGRVEGGAV